MNTKNHPIVLNNVINQVIIRFKFAGFENIRIFVLCFS